MADNTIMGVVVLFIGVVILIGITPIILGNTSDIGACQNLDGYTPAVAGVDANDDGDYDDAGDTAPVAAQYTGWAQACVNSNETNQDSFDVILVIPVVVAAVAILMVVRFL